jgi:hypothetical protein
MKMKGLLLIPVYLVVCHFCYAQTPKNGAFENWNSTPVDVPTGWGTANPDAISSIGQQTVTKTTDAQAGTAVKLETKAGSQDTMFGYVTNSVNDPRDGKGGAPYTQQPTHFTGYYKYSVPSGDTAAMMVVFKKAGVVVSTDYFPITGTQSTYTSFSLALTLAVVPDTVIVAAVSSNAFNEDAPRIPGSFLMIDELGFSGTGITQTIPNGNFETWTTESVDELIDWEYYSREGVKRTTDAYKGTYAVELTTMDFGDGNISNAGITSGSTSQSGSSGGDPFSATADTLVFYYKFIPQGPDSAQVMINLFKLGIGMGGIMEEIPPAATYTRMEVPFSSGLAPDTIRIDFQSSTQPVLPSNNGSRLVIDEVHLKSQPLNTGVFRVKQSESVLLFYPNPASENIEIRMNSLQQEMMKLTIYDITGRVVYLSEENVEAGGNILSLPVKDLPAGTYYCQLIGSGAAVKGKFVKK